MLKPRTKGNGVLHEIPESRTEWPENREERFEALMVREMTRILEIDNIAKFAIEEEGAACVQILSDDWEDIRHSAAEMMQRLNGYIRRQEKIMLRELKVSGIDTRGLEYPMTPREALDDLHSIQSAASFMGDEKRYKAAQNAEMVLLGKYPEMMVSNGD